MGEMQGHLEDISANLVLVVAHLGNNVAHLLDVVETQRLIKKM